MFQGYVTVTYPWNGDGNVRTITQIASELSISRKRVYNLIERLNIATTRDGRNNFIDDKEFERIKNDILNLDGNNTKERLKNTLKRDRYVTGDRISDREYTDLKERIISLEEQLKNKDELFIEQLQAKDNQINGLIQSNLNFSRALNSPINEMAAAIIDPEKKGFWSRIFRT